MSQFPPPVPPQYTAPYASPFASPPPRRTNGWAVVSLICGLIGCLLVTPFIAIGSGVVGLAKSKQLGNGRGLAIAGIVLGLLWIPLLAGVGVFGYFVYDKAVVFLNSVKPQTVALINHVEAGNVTPDATTNALTAAQLQAISDKAKPLGACQAITASGTTYNNNNGVVEAGFSGTATFEHGQLPVRVKMRANTAGGQLAWVFEEVELQ